MRLTTTFTLFAALLASATLLKAAPPEDSPIRFIPAEAGAVLVFRDMDKFRSDTLGFIKNVGAPIEDFEEARREFPKMSSFNLKEQFDAKRGATVFVTVPRNLEEDPAWVILLPVQDSEKAISRLNAKATDEKGIHRFKVDRENLPEILPGLEAEAVPRKPKPPVEEPRDVEPPQVEDPIGEEKGTESNEEESADGQKAAPTKVPVPQDDAADAKSEEDEEDKEAPKAEMNEAFERVTEDNEERLIELHVAAVNDSLLAITEKRAPLKRYMSEKPDGKGFAATLTESQLKVLEQSDLFFSVPLEPWRPMIDLVLAGAALNRGKQANAKEADDQKDENDAPRLEEGADAVEEFESTKLVKWLTERGKSLAKQTRGVYGGLLVEPKFVGGTLRVAFEDGSQLRQETAKAAQGGSDPFAGLPDRPYIIAGTIDFSQMAPLVEHFILRADELLEEAKNEPKEEREMARKALRYVKQAKRISLLLDVERDGFVGLLRAGFDKPKEVWETARPNLEEYFRKNQDDEYKLEFTQTEVNGHSLREYKAVELKQTTKEESNENNNSPDKTVEEKGQEFDDFLFTEAFRVQAGVIDETIVLAAANKADPAKMVPEGEGQSLLQAESVKGTAMSLARLGGEEPLAGVLVDPARLTRFVVQAWSLGMGDPKGKTRKEQFLKIFDRFEQTEPTPPAGMALFATNEGLSLNGILFAGSIRPVVEAMKAEFEDEKDGEAVKKSKKPAPTKVETAPPTEADSDQK